MINRTLAFVADKARLLIVALVVVLAAVVGGFVSSASAQQGGYILMDCESVPDIEEPEGMSEPIVYEKCYFGWPVAPGMIHVKVYYHSTSPREMWIYSGISYYEYDYMMWQILVYIINNGNLPS